MIHSNTINRAQITSLPRFEEKHSLNPAGSKNEVDELRKALKSSQNLIVTSVKFPFLYLIIC